MDRGQESILVTGVTGRQGGAVARHLMDDGWHVRALVRDPSKPAAIAIARAGAELVVGDLLDTSSLDRAVAGAYGVYSVQTFRRGGVDDEVLQGVNLADSAKAASVRHFVYSSVRGADRPDGLFYVASKHRIEGHILQIGLPATVWRPVTFMENFLYQKDSILAGTISGPDPPAAMKQTIAVDDIGRFVALAFSDRERFLGVTMEIAGDEMPWTEAAATFARLLRRPVAYQQTGPTPEGPPPRAAELERLRSLIPDLVTLERWIEAQDWGA
jgi:uncharacterized protein YbjT (DUF2867 family)